MVSVTSRIAITDTTNEQGERARREKRALRVAVIGARGIGKHHAKWWRLDGAEVCAFAGVHPEVQEKTAQGLRELFPFEGRGYTDVGAMIEKERPDIVDVCSPPPCHYGHVRTALESGCHVLCEKPFVYDAQLESDALRDQARELIFCAQSRGLWLSVCTQYAAGAAMFARIWKDLRRGEIITHYHGHLESPARNRAPDPRRVWVDLSPHPLSVLLSLAPDAEIVPASLRTTFQGYEALAEFDVRTSSGSEMHAIIVTRNALQPPLNVRHFKYNGYPFVVEGQNDADGVYCARIETPNGNYLEPDMMHAVIRDFLKGSPTADVNVCSKNLDFMLRIMDAAKSE
jgi:predicted dehydrogenase